MKTSQAMNRKTHKLDPLTSELLVLPDGRILVHNLTQPFAELLQELNPSDKQIAPRALPHPASRIPNHELPD